MQTADDADQVRALGITEDRLRVLGNLKYDTAVMDDANAPALERSAFNLPANSMIWLCGSTHRGEEEMLLAVFADLQAAHPDLALIIAPRDPARGGEIASMAASRDLRANLRSSGSTDFAPVFILDTIGELTECYRSARVAFIGGSMVPCGGHNPLEAAIHGVPAFFGPHMEDFQEISRDLVRSGAAKTVTSAHEIKDMVGSLLRNDALHDQMSIAARNLVSRNSGVIDHHLDCIIDLLPSAPN